MFRRAIAKGTFDGQPETFYFVEVNDDSWIGTNRLCASEDEAREIKESTGHGKRKTGSMQLTMATRYLRMTSDELEILEPA